jgi:hypothetical protein
MSTIRNDILRDGDHIAAKPNDIRSRRRSSSSSSSRFLTPAEAKTIPAAVVEDDDINNLCLNQIPVDVFGGLVLTCLSISDIANLLSTSKTTAACM